MCDPGLLPDPQPGASPAGVPGPAGVPRSASEALGMVRTAFGWLADADLAGMPAGTRAECLRELERVRSVQTAAHAAVLPAFDHDSCYADDGQGTSRTWLRTDLLPESARTDADTILLAAAVNGAELADLATSPPSAPPPCRRCWTRSARNRARRHPHHGLRQHDALEETCRRLIAVSHHDRHVQVVAREPAAPHRAAFCRQPCRCRGVGWRHVRPAGLCRGTR